MKIKLKKITDENNELLKDYYIWMLNEPERDKFTYTPAGNQIIPFSEVGFNNFSQQIMKHLKTKLIYIAIDEKTDESLGFIQLEEYNFRNKNAVLGFYLPSSSRDKGVGSAMLEQGLKLFFSDDFEWDLYRISAETCSENKRSKRLMEKFGFQLEGIMKDYYWFGENKFDQHWYGILNHNKKTAK